LPLALDQRRPSRSLGKAAFDEAVVERHDVVLDRLDQPQPLQLGELPGMLLGQVACLRPIGVGVGAQLAAAVMMFHVQLPALLMNNSMMLLSTAR
jgi:hypothetical protein